MNQAAEQTNQNLYAKPAATQTVIFPEYMTREERQALECHGQSSVFRFLKGQPDYLTQNWLRVLGQVERGSLRAVRVGYDGVATIANKYVLIRTPIPDCPAGYYIIKDGDSLKGNTTVVTPPALSTWTGAFEGSVANPRFDELARLNPVAMGGDVALQFAMWCQAVRQIRGTVIIGRDHARIHFSDDPSKRFNFPFGISHEARLDPEVLVMAFTEASRYPIFYITREPDKAREMPLVIGINWAHCILAGAANMEPFE